MIAAMVTACAALNLAVAGWAVWARPALNSDFLAFWSFPRFAAAHPVAGIYNAAALTAFQQSLYPGFHSFYPFLYPPSFLAVIWWLHFWSYPAAQVLWTLGGLALLAGGGWLFFQGRRPWLALIAMLASPASLLNFMTGETAYFTAALLLTGFALLPKRPVLAGIAFGLLTLKPQLGVLVPLALLARGDWRAIFTAGIVAAALVTLSCLVFPSALWLIWAKTLPVYQTQYFNGRGLNLNIIVTPAANLFAAGAPAAFAWAVQILVSLLAATAVFICFRRAVYPLAVAALLCGSFLAVPHAYAYDSITLIAAMTLCLNTVKIPVFWLGLGVTIYLGPFLLLTPAYHWFLYALPEALLFAGIILLALRDSNRALFADEPELFYPGAE